MIRPSVLRSDRPHGPWSCRGRDIWDAMQAAASGDTAALRRVLKRDPNLYRAEYWYTQPILFAVREGHIDATHVLLEAGADPAWTALNGEDLVTMARDRGHAEVAALLEAEHGRRSEISEAVDTTPDVDEVTSKAPPIHSAASQGDTARVRSLLDADPRCLEQRDHEGATPLYRAVAASARDVVELLLERGVDPNAPDGSAAPRGASLHVAARSGDRAMVELLLAHGADPNATIDASGSATYAARTPEIRALLQDHGGTLDTYDLVWLDEDDEAVRRVRADPATANAGCGGALAAACKLGKRELVVRLLEAGARVPPRLTECRSYLWSEPETLRLLLDSGMDPDLPDWQQATPLHDLCSRDWRGRPRPHRAECASMFLEAGATLGARDEHYCSTPLAWAARTGLDDMIELLLDRGAEVEQPDTPPWATPLAWAERRGHEKIAERLRQAGASD